MILNQIKRSIYGKVCDASNNILEHKGQLCYIPNGNTYFRKCLEYIYERSFSNEYKEFLIDSHRCKNIMTSAKIQPFSRKYNINLGVYKKNNDQLLKTITEERMCLHIHDNRFCIIWKTNQSTFPDAIEERENNFKYEETHINDNRLQQVVEYKFPISYEMNCF